MAGALARRAQAFLLEPEAPPGKAAAPAFVASSAGHDVSVAVVGLAAGSGATVVSWGLAQVLARAERPVNLLLAGSRPPPRQAMAALTPWEVPAALTEPGEVATYGRTVARLAGQGHEGRLSVTCVWGVPARAAARAAEATAGADVTVALAGTSAEPALSGLVAGLLAERCPQVLLVANRVAEPGPWSHWAAACLPESRIGAAMLSRGRAPGGELGAAIRGLASLVDGVASGAVAPRCGLYREGERA